ncbi:MAG: hypothetical protein GY719_17610 [bacterium]|nr:hypothetical protein [bacterium]
MPPLDIPKSQKKPLELLLNLGPESRRELLDNLEGKGADLVASTNPLADTAGLSEDAAEEVLYMLLGLYQAYGRKIVRPALLVETLKSDETLGLLVKDAEEELVAFFERLFALESSLGILSKVFRLATEHERRFCTADIMTDLRPVFDDVESGPVAATIVNTLRLTFHQGPRFELEEVFIGLGESDLNSLSSTVDRALKKCRSLSGYAKTADLPLLATGDE